MYKDVEHYVDFLIEEDITQHQFLAVYLLFTGKKTTLRRYRDKFGGLSEDDITHLVKKGFITETYGKNDVRIHKVGENFLERFIDRNEAAHQFWELYPINLEIGGQIFTAKGMPMDDFVRAYTNAYKGFLKEHKEIIKDLKYGLDNNLIKVKLQTYMDSHMWLQHRTLRKADTSTTSNTQSKSIYDNDL